MLDNDYLIKGDMYQYNLGWMIKELMSFKKDLATAIDLKTIKYADPIQWDITTQYPANTVVVDPKSGTAYMSKVPVPAGVELKNDNYWVIVFNYQDIYNKIMDGVAFNDRDQSYATKDLHVNDLVWYAGDLYRATRNITAGSKYIPETNLTRTTIESLLASYYGNDRTAHVINDTVNASGNHTLTADNITETSTNHTTNVTNDREIDINGSDIVNINGNSTVTIGGTRTEVYKGNKTEKINGTSSETYTGTHTENHDGAKILNAEDIVLNPTNPLTYKIPDKLNKTLKTVTFKDTNYELYKVLVLGDSVPAADFVDVTGYGIDNTGKNDCAEILNRMMTNGGNFYFPAGTYLLKSQLLLNSNTHIKGESAESVILIADPNMDAVYHTICSANANNINARLGVNPNSPFIAQGYPNVDDVCTFDVKNISIENITVDGNWQNRNLASWNKYYNSPSRQTIEREPGTNIELQRVQNAWLNNVRAINGIQHNINVRAGAYCYNQGKDMIAKYPSEYIKIEKCYASNERYDDNITTHDSQYIVIDSCVAETPNNANGIYSAAVGNGIEIDDGSRFVVVSNCVSRYGIAGFQAKGHDNNTPPAHDVVFINCLAEYNHHAYDFSSNPGDSFTTTKDVCRNISVINCIAKNDYAFSNDSQWPSVSHPIAANNVRNLKIRNFTHICGIPTGLSNIAKTQFSQCRFRGNCSFCNLDGFSKIGASENATDAYIKIDGTARNFIIKNVYSDGYSGNPLIKYNSTNIGGACVIDSVYEVKRNDNDVIATVDSNVPGTRSNMIFITN